VRGEFVVTESLQEFSKPGWIKNQNVSQEQSSQGKKKQHCIEDDNPQGQQNTACHTHKHAPNGLVALL